jgi:Ca2+-transporting ATPase
MSAPLKPTSTPPHGRPAVIGGVPGQPSNPARRAFHAVPPEQVAKYWWSDINKGLDPDEAQKRLSRLGPNKLAEKPPPSLLSRIIAQVTDATVLALLGAAVIAAVLSIVAPEPGVGFLARFGDSIAILLIVVINAILGLLNEKKAEKALAALRDMTAPVARVVRGGKVSEVPAAQLVPGDVILLEEGDKVAADVRLAVTHDLDVEEAALTGESVPVSKDASIALGPETALADRINMAYMGTRVTRGRARGVVCNTGMHTELGAIAGMLAEVEDEDTPLQQQLDAFGKQIVIGCVVVSAIVFGAGWFFADQSARQMFLVAVSLAVAAIPEGLPAITTIVLALGTTRMARRNALVRRLPAVETLGCAQIVCTDKTGTLTQNAMTVRRLWAGGTVFHVGGEGRQVEGEIKRDGGELVSAASEPALALAVHAAAHASGAKLHANGAGAVEISGDPTDAALLILAWKGKRHQHEGVIAAEVPFTSSRRMATVIASEGGTQVAFVRGAPEVILGLSERVHEGGAPRPLGAEDRERIAAVAADWGKEAMRVVALAVREHPPDDPDPSHWEKALTFVSLVGIVDPPRPEVKPAIAEAASAGIRSVMITGDHPATARAIATELGMFGPDDMVVTGAQLDEWDDQRLVGEVEKVRVVARATAEHKLRIVEALKERGKICAMTGDGVNDAPAVKSAHIGVAMGKAGTEVTKEAADLVLADDNYATIVAAVEEGRAIYANIRKFIYFLLSSNAGIVLMVLVASLAGWAAPLTPIQILWINLITNGLPALALGVDPKDPDQMRQPPRPAGGRLMPARDWWSMLGVGAVMAATSLVAFYLAAGGGGTDLGDHDADLARARTLAFAVLSMSPMFHALNCRSSTRSIFQLGLFTNRALWGAIAIGVALQAMAVYVTPLRPVFHTASLSGSDVGLVMALSALPLLIGETIKIFIRARMK